MTDRFLTIHWKTNELIIQTRIERHFLDNVFLYQTQVESAIKFAITKIYIQTKQNNTLSETILFPINNSLLFS